MTVTTLSSHETQVFPKGTKIIREGEMPSAAYLIKDGVVRVYKECDGKEHEITKLSSGQIMGEMALLSHRYHTMTVEAVSDTEAFIIRPERLAAELAQTSPLIKTIVETLLDRIYVFDEAICQSHAK